MGVKTDFLNAQFIEPIWKIVTSDVNADEIQLNRMLDCIYSFSIQGLPEVKADKKDDSSKKSVLKVYHNILQRGLPTKTSVSAEESLKNKYGYTIKKVSEIGTIAYDWKEDFEITKDDLFEALHIIDPRFQKNSDYNWQSLESSFEKWFIQKTDNILPQLLHCQRYYESMVDNKTASKHIDQRTDFSLEFLSKDKKKNGVNIEIDGEGYHRDIIFDENRDQDLKQNHWLTARISSANAERDFKAFNTLLDKQFDLTPFYENAAKQLTDEKWRTKLQLIFSPLAQVRIQRALIEYLIRTEYEFKQPIKVAVIQRDFTGASDALIELKESIEHLLSMSGINFPGDWLIYDTYVSKDFSSDAMEATLNEQCQCINYDLVIDNALLIRENIDNKPLEQNYVKIRSTHYRNRKSKRVVETGMNIGYAPLGHHQSNEEFMPDEQQVEHLKYFLQNIFRKVDFRIGQIEILSRSLQNKSVIGLLPTGGGKSLTYQISAILQPGVCLIIDPIKSLMYDQYSNLKKMGIDMAGYINSSLSAVEKRKETQKFNDGQYLFAFVSPERLLIEDFREGMRLMNSEDIYFSYGVIDEVHCVSEWGHDFRTSYLSLGENIIKHSKSSQKEHSIPLIGLTATASYDVLADVQRELSFDSKLDEESVVRHENTIRDEIQYIVEEVKTNFKKAKDNSLTLPTYRSISEEERDLPVRKDMDIKSHHGHRKQREIIKRVNNIKHYFSTYNLPEIEKVISYSSLNFQINQNIETDSKSVVEKIMGSHLPIQPGGVLIFTPHASWCLGVTDKYKRLKKDQRPVGLFETLEHNTELKVGTFIGSGNDEKYAPETQEKIDAESQENQEKFINNQLDVMVATKAFGMGIDKENIRASIHFNIPSSIESFVQEGGRVARDRKLGFNVLLINRQEYIYWGKSTIKELYIDRNFSNSQVKNLESIFSKYKNKWFEKNAFLKLLESKGVNEFKNDFQRIAINVDKNVLDHFHNNSFPGEWEEKAIVNNVLSDDSITIKDVLSEQISDIYNCNIVLGSSKKYEKSLWVNIDGDGIGYYHSKYRNVNPRSGFEDRADYLKQILQKAFELKPDLKIQNQDYYHFLSQRAQGQSIREWLNESREEKCYFDIYFQNSPLKISIWNENLKNTIKEIDGIPENSIQNIIHRANNFKELKYLIEFKIERQITKVEGQKINFAFFNYRKRQDTDKAIYRLKLIGLIDDYAVDYNKNKYKVLVKRREIGEYLNFYRNYLQRYYSTKRVDNLLKDLEAKENLDIEDIIDHQVDFTYREIARKRRRAIIDMYDAAEQYLLIEQDNKGREDAHVIANNYLKEYIYLYFNSKYARRDYEIEGEDYSLISENHTDNGREQKLEWVDKFIKATTLEEGQINNLKHLRGATMRILRTNLQNATALMLKSYALLLLSVNNAFLLNEAKESYFDGLMSFYLNDYLPNNYTIVEFLQETRFFKAHVEENSSQQKLIELINEVEEEFSVEAHNQWLEKFKEKFLNKYQETYG